MKRDTEAECGDCGATVALRRIGAGGVLAMAFHRRSDSTTTRNEKGALVPVQLACTGSGMRVRR